jgi:tetratricopeptide (TPR) repeat protein
LKNRLRIAAVLLLLAGVLAGCSGKNENTEAGMQALRDLDYDSAAICFDSAEEAGENARLIARGRGILSMGRTDYEAAVDYFTAALQGSNGQLEPIDYDLNYYLAAAQTKLGDYVAAESCYDAILALDEQEDACFLRGNVRIASGRFEEARQDYDRVIAMDPDNYGRIIEIYNELSAFGYREAGLEYLQAVLDRGKDKLTDLEKGKIHYYMGDYSNAALSLEAARSASADPESYLYLGQSYEAMGEYNYASNVYENFLSQVEGNAVIYNQLGLCYMKMGNYEGALTSFGEGMKLGDAAMAQSLSFNEAVTYEYLGRYHEAALLMENYLKTYPDDAVAQREYIFLETRE